MTKATFKRSEEADQALAVKWFGLQHPCEARWLHHSPNGGKRNAVTGARMRSLGAKTGFPDLVLYQQRGSFIGLVIECKRADGGVISKTQKGWLNQLENQGFCCIVAHGFDEIVEALKSYMALDVVMF